METDLLDVNTNLIQQHEAWFTRKTRRILFCDGCRRHAGVPAPPERMQVFAKSEFGSSFFVPERLRDKHNFSVRDQSLNWFPSNFIHGLKLISMSINNILAFLKVFHRVRARCEILLSSDDAADDEPWSRSTGGMAFTWHSPITEQAITPLTKDEMLLAYDDNDGGTKDDTKPTA